MEIVPKGVNFDYCPTSLYLTNEFNLNFTLIDALGTVVAIEEFIDISDWNDQTERVQIYGNLTSNCTIQGLTGLEFHSDGTIHFTNISLIAPSNDIACDLTLSVTSIIQLKNNPKEQLHSHLFDQLVCTALLRDCPTYHSIDTQPGKAGCERKSNQIQPNPIQSSADLKSIAWLVGWLVGWFW